MTHSHVKKIVFLIGFWLLCTVYIMLYDNALMIYTGAPLDPGRNFTAEMSVALLVTLLGASFAAPFDVLVLSRLLRRRPLGRVLLTKTVFWSVCILVFNSLAQLLIFHSQTGASLLSPESGRRYLGYISSPYLVMISAYWGIAVLLGLFLVQVADKFGQGVLISFLLGRYHRPKEEDRIFMFIDLTSSTAYAESLGHLRYSQLIQDCFFDLTDVVVKRHAIVYQYVGDEVVLTWDVETGLDQANCLRSFFDFDRAIQARRDHYLSRYGMLPQFKAGLNAGVVTAAEVGEIKKELAYHGDVLNTASRIQGKCNELGSRLLLSESLRKRIGEAHGFAFHLLGRVELKGKKDPVDVYDARMVAV
jgi:adenylate cyclase